MKNINFLQAGELHRRAGWQTARTTGQASGLHIMIKAGWRAAH